MNGIRKNNRLGGTALTVGWKVNSIEHLLVLTKSLILIMSFLLLQGMGWAAERGAKMDSTQAVSYPVELFESGRAYFFERETAEGIKIRYFVLKSSDGVVRSAFDACDACWPAGKGYKQEGEFMVCRNCGMRVPSKRINEVKGGCNPVPLARQVIQDRVVIKLEDILEGRRYFDFSRRDRK